MGSLDVLRLAAVDMHGVAGTLRRRRRIRAEFVVGPVGGMCLGVWVAATAGTALSQLFGAWVAGVGVNYAALAWQAALLSRPGALEAELAGIDMPGELRRHCYLKFWVGAAPASSPGASPTPPPERRHMIGHAGPPPGGCRTGRPGTVGVVAETQIMAERSEASEILQELWARIDARRWDGQIAPAVAPPARIRISVGHRPRTRTLLLARPGPGR